MFNALTSRARGCLLGLAVGDALGGPTEGKSPQAIRQQWGRVTGYLSEQQTGSDDTEYALLNARFLLKHRSRISAALIAGGWRAEVLSGQNTYKGAGFSEMLAMRNLKEGLEPPESGMHLHSWSDGLAMRVAPFGIVASGRPGLAAELARMDGSVTHSGEGIYGGQAVAAAIALAMEGAEIPAIIEAARTVIPGDSWTRRALDRAVACGEASPDVWSALEPLREAVVTPAYFWSDIAPEAVALAFGLIVAARGGFIEAVLGGVNIGRDTDTIAAIAGAILGGLQGEEAVPPAWSDRVTVSRGGCLQIVKEMNIIDTADQLAELSRCWRSGG
jgi:ADP-ribosylglycohydrolase